MRPASHEMLCHCYGNYLELPSIQVHWICSNLIFLAASMTTFAIVAFFFNPAWRLGYPLLMIAPVTLSPGLLSSGVS